MAASCLSFLKFIDKNTAHSLLSVLSTYFICLGKLCYGGVHPLQPCQAAACEPLLWPICSLLVALANKKQTNKQTVSTD
jgi:hypothetical protein